MPAAVISLIFLTRIFSLVTANKITGTHIALSQVQTFHKYFVRRTKE